MNTHPFLQKLLNGQTVEWKPLGEVADIVGGNVFPKEYQGDTISEVPFYKVSDMNNEGNEHYMHNACNYVDQSVIAKLKLKCMPENTVIFPKIGAAIATNKKRLLSQTSVCDNNIFGVIAKKEVQSSFLFYIFQNVDLMDFANGAGAVPSISKETLSKFQIPIPPLSVQTEIVRILDTFTALTAELTHELALRQKQYQYYRDLLLTFDDINLAGGGGGE